MSAAKQGFDFAERARRRAAQAEEIRRRVFERRTTLERAGAAILLATDAAMPGGGSLTVSIRNNDWRLGGPTLHWSGWMVETDAHIAAISRRKHGVLPRALTAADAEGERHGYAVSDGVIFATADTFERIPAAVMAVIRGVEIALEAAGITADQPPPAHAEADREQPSEPEPIGDRPSAALAEYLGSLAADTSPSARGLAAAEDIDAALLRIEDQLSEMRDYLIVEIGAAVGNRVGSAVFEQATHGALRRFVAGAIVGGVVASLANIAILVAVALIALPEGRLDRTAGAPGIEAPR